jgi:hypothetical protein
VVEFVITIMRMGGRAASGLARSADRWIVVGLGSAISCATLAQGAYYPSGLLPVLLLVGFAVVARAMVRRRHVDGAVAVAAACLVALALWNVAVGWWHDDLRAGLPAVALACCVAAAAVAATGLSDSSRRVLQLAMIALGVVVAGSAWTGVALHAAPLALPSSGLWRGASTLTYANAAAAFLVIAPSWPSPCCRQDDRPTACWPCCWSG